MCPVICLGSIEFSVSKDSDQADQSFLGAHEALLVLLRDGSYNATKVTKYSLNLSYITKGENVKIFQS